MSCLKIDTLMKTVTLRCMSNYVGGRGKIYIIGMISKSSLLNIYLASHLYLIEILPLTARQKKIYYVVESLKGELHSCYPTHHSFPSKNFPAIQRKKIKAVEQNLIWILFTIAVHFLALPLESSPIQVYSWSKLI